MALVIFEDAGYQNLLPFTYWRPIAELRTGYFSLLEYALRATRPRHVTLYCRQAVARVATERLNLPVNKTPEGEAALLVNARLLLTTALEHGPLPSVQWVGDTPAVIHADARLLDRLTPELLLDRAAMRQVLAHVPEHTNVSSPRLIHYAWDLGNANGEMLEFGWRAVGSPAERGGRLCPGAHLLNPSAIHIGEGSVIKPGAVLDAENGSIFVGDHVTISANCCIEGPCYIGGDSLIQPGAALRHAISIGRRCKAGGELETSIIQGYSNKQHDGFLGHAYVGEWVNLAADTVNSDLKNTYGTVRVPVNGVEVESGQMFVGLMIGDHSKTGIGQMFPTGAVVGFGCNVATCEFSPRFVPSFTWLTGRGSTRYDLERCLDVGKRVMARRNVVMSPAEETLFRSIPELAARVERPILE
jgi:UDP-N-acetylglucosamine diphosphorylase/glucosamine-1-phosphate N-acetyltransferase